MRHNILIEFTLTDKNLLNKLETVCKSNELFLAEWQKIGNNLRILSEFSEIKDMMFKAFNKNELKKLSYHFIPMEDYKLE